MPDCTHPKCGRKELPSAPMFPPQAKIACAHANPKGEPCPESPSADVYDPELLAIVVKNDDLWDDEFVTAVDGPSVEGVERPRSVDVGAAVSVTGSELIRPAGDARRPALFDLSERRAIANLGLSSSAPAADVRRAIIDAPPGAMDPPAQPAKPARAKRRAAKKAPANDDVDEWDPEA